MKIFLLALTVLTSSAAYADCARVNGVTRCNDNVDVHRGYNGRAAYNSNTGNAAVQTRNSNGVSLA